MIQENARLKAACVILTVVLFAVGLAGIMFVEDLSLGVITLMVAFFFAGWLVGIEMSQ